MLLLLLWAFPIAVAHSPLVRWIEQQLTVRTGYTVRIGTLSLGWFSAVTAGAVEIDDGAGHPLLRAQTVQSRRTLLGLLLNRDDPGGFKIEQAAIEIVLAGAASNLDDALTQFIEKPAAVVQSDSGSASLPPFDIEVVDSSLRISETTIGNTWRMQSVQASLRLFHDDELPVEGRIVGAVGDGAGKGMIEASVAVHADAGVWKSGEVKARLSGVSLALATPLITRVAVERKSEASPQLAGTLQGQVRLSWSMDHTVVSEVTVQGEVTARSCKIVLPQLAESLLLDQVRIPFQVRCDGTHVDVANAEVVCDLGHAHYAGLIDLAAPGLAWLDVPGHELSATIELVRLAEKLPQTLSIHPDLRVTSGQIRLDAHNGAADDPEGWVVRLNVTNITGVRGKQPIVWHEPVTLDCRARHLGAGVPLLEEVRCTSGFLTLDGAMTPDGFFIHGDADLGKLADPLSRFVELGPARLAGQVHGECTVRPAAEGRFNAVGTGRVRDLFVEWIKGRTLEEDLLNLDFATVGRVDADGAQTIETARIAAQVGPDRVQAELAEPLPALVGPDWGVWQVRLEGDLARWQKRARAVAPAIDQWQLGGAVVAQGQLRRGVRGMECPDLAVSLRDFHSTGRGMHINEPTLYMHGAAAFDDAGALHLRDMQFRCPTVAATASRLRWLPDTGEGWGAVTLRGDIGRLQQWLGERGYLTGPLDGEVDGQLEFHPEADGMTYRFECAIQGLLWNGELFSPRGEPAFRLHGRARLENAEDRMLVGPVHVDGPLGAIVLHAHVANLSGSCDVDLRGECDYDLPRLATLFDTDLDVRIAGKGTRSFTLAGPLRPADASGLLLHMAGGHAVNVPRQVGALRGDMSVGLQSLHLQGCDIGPAELHFCLQQGWLQLYPLETAFNGGRLRLQPHLRLDPGPPEVMLLGGTAIEKARITPELCDGLLGLALPALGHVAQVEGTMSLVLEGARIPLSDVSRAQVKGKIVLHGARFGPGPLSRELAGAFKTSPPSCAVREAEIPFHLINGRVYHRDLELTFPDFTIRSSGSVGLDGSLALLIEMPVPVKLLGTAKVSPALAKQTIRLPIVGTVHEPRIDQHALQAIAGQIMRQIAADALQREVERKLKGLLQQGQ